MIYPKKIAQHEDVIATFQDHWILLLKPLLVFLFGSGVFLFLFYCATLLQSISDLSSFLLMLLAFGILFLSHHFFFLFILEWIVSSMVVTTCQIINFRIFPFVEDDVAYIEIKEIHEIDKEKHGIVKNLLNYGDVFIHLSGKGFPVDLHHVRHPGRFVDMIEALRFEKPLENIDFHRMGANFSSKYMFLKK